MNISTASRDSVNDLVDNLNQISDYRLDPIYEEARSGDILHSSLANAKAKEILDWSPDYDFKSGLKQTVEYYS
jgi:UDP-glucose 4-epimerase